MPDNCLLRTLKVWSASLILLLMWGTSHAQSDSYPALPPVEIPLNDVSAFRPTGSNWRIVGNVMADFRIEQSLTATAGRGILANLSDEKNRSHLFTKFEHGDIELELDVMMPKGSNSGIYLQGRYELQLFDSWGKDDTKYSYMAGIYQRTDTATNQGFEGSAPIVNACRAPGLWQSLRIIFKAPVFDADGKKLSDARFDKVWLNGMLVQDNAIVSGPTRSSAYQDEKPAGPLMFQGNHGRVAFRNIRYKVSDGQTVAARDLVLREFKTPGESFRSAAIRTLEKVAEQRVDSISRHLATQQDVFLMEYRGILEFPRTGSYMFTLQTGGGGCLLINGDTIISHDGARNFSSIGEGMYRVRNNSLPFTLIYNKPIQYRQGLALYAEGPGMARHPLHAPGSPFLQAPVTPLIISVPDENAVIQRSFVADGNGKRTHCLSVGTHAGVHFTVDLAMANLFQVWDGGFLDATPMWHSRGNEQVGIPLGASILFPALPLVVRNGKAVDINLREYELDAAGLPQFVYQAGSSTVRDKVFPVESNRAVTRKLTVERADDIVLQLAQGTTIERVDDRTFMVNDKEFYFILESPQTLVEIKRSNGFSTLVLRGDNNDQLEIAYTLMW